MKFFRTSLSLLTAGSVALVAWACGDPGESAGTGQAFGGSAGAGTGGTGTGGTGTSGTGGSGGSAAAVQWDGGGSGTGGTLGDGDVCAGQVSQGSLVPAQMLFVVDRSGSMNCLPGEPEGSCSPTPVPGSKWALTNSAIKLALQELSQAPNINAGLSLFPVAGSNCVVSGTPNVFVKPLDGAQVSGLNAVLDAVDPAGSTPIAGATILGFRYLDTRLAAAGNKFVVLITDGSETCRTQEIPKLLTQDIPAALSVGIRTFVIGVKGAEEGRSLLSQMAYLGGTARSTTCNHDPSNPPTQGDCHFDLTTSSDQDFARDLTDALRAISGTVLTCEFDLPQATGGVDADPEKVNVSLNGTGVPKDLDQTCDNGWQYTDATKTKITLCGTFCADAKKPNAQVNIQLGCPYEPPA